MVGAEGKGTTKRTSYDSLPLSPPLTAAASVSTWCTLSSMVTLYQQAFFNGPTVCQSNHGLNAAREPAFCLSDPPLPSVCLQSASSGNRLVVQRPIFGHPGQHLHALRQAQTQQKVLNLQQKSTREPCWSEEWRLMFLG